MTMHAIKFDVCRLHGWQPFVGTAAEAAITTSHQSRCFLQAGSLLTRTTAAEAAAAAADAAAEAAPGAASADTRRALQGALAAAWALEQCCFVTESCDVHSDTWYPCIYRQHTASRTPPVLVPLHPPPPTTGCHALGHPLPTGQRLRPARSCEVKCSVREWGMICICIYIDIYMYTCIYMPIDM